MKRIIAILVAFMGFTLCHGQLVQNNSFENLTGGTADDWSYDQLGGGLDTVYARTGNYSLSVWNWYWYAKGYAASGEFSGFNPEHAGTALNVKPTSLKGYYMYDTTNTDTNNDSAIVIVIAKKFNGISSDTVAYGEMHLPSAHPTDGWVQFNVPMNDLMPGVDPDSVAIFFQSSISGFCSPANGECLYFYVDDLELNTVNGVFDMSSELKKTKIYPNPSNDWVNVSIDEANVERLIIRDLMGRIVMQSNDLSNEVKLDISFLKKAMYSLELWSNDGIISRNNLIVQ